MVTKKHSAAILQSLNAGVVPRVGLEHIVVGREKELEQIKIELRHVKQGSAGFKMLIGNFGSGKSFVLSLIRQLAMKENFAVADVDFTPERKLYGSGGHSLATYSELMKNLSTRTRPEGNAFPVILERWISNIQLEVEQEGGYESGQYDNPVFIRNVQRKIDKSLSQMEELTGGFDFSLVIKAYFRGYLNNSQAMMSNAVRWLRGEYTTKTEARQDLGVRSIINDDDWYEYLKVIASFIHQVGYAGLIVNFDEAINLYKITHSGTRNKNYESILKLYNDTLQGKAGNIYITFAGTKEFLENEKRGLFSYQALKTRLSPNRLETKEYRDYSQPVIRLSPLRKEEVTQLLKKIRDIHGHHYGYEPVVTESDIEIYVDSEYQRSGAVEFVTPRDMIRHFISALNLLYQNPSMKKEEIFETEKKQDWGAATTMLNRFQQTRQ